jgi:hypothetical protein
MSDPLAVITRVPAVDRAAGREQHRAHGTAHAVGADDDVRLPFLDNGGCPLRLARIHGGHGGAGDDPDAAGQGPLVQRGVQTAAVHPDEPHRLARDGGVREGEDRPALQVPDAARPGRVPERGDVVVPEAEPAERGHGVGGHGQAGPDLTELRRPLQDRDLPPGPCQRDGRGQACDTGPDDNRSVSHALSATPVWCLVGHPLPGRRPAAPLPASAASVADRLTQRRLRHGAGPVGLRRPAGGSGRC